jgi:hypothetical protein
MSFTSGHQPHSVTDRPGQHERGTDCLVPLLTDFLTLDLRSLSPEAFESWMSIIADCLWTFAKSDLRLARPSLGTRAWFRLVSHHVTQHFPDYPGGPVGFHTDFACLILSRRTQGQETC